MATADAFEEPRQRMVREQLQARGIRNPHVLAALARVPRERFVAPGYEEYAYDDRALGIDCAQTISQPYIVALMTEALDLTGAERVLEVGTGSGYQAAVLALLAAEVVTIERHLQLSVQAQTRLVELGYTNVEFVIGDGNLGYAPRAPYDRVIITAAAREPSPAVWEQLREGGVLVAPLGGEQGQVLERIEKRRGRPHAVPLTECRFVPLLPGTAAREETQ